MRVSFENMQRGAVVSERARSGFDRSTCADSRNNQSKDRDTLGASARRLLLRECGASQDAVRKMKVAEPIHIEFLQAERLEDFFVFHRHRPMPEVTRHPATTEGCRTENYFCGLSRNHNCERNEKLTGERSRARRRKVRPIRLMHPSGSRGCEPGLAFDGRVLAATACVLPFTSGCITTFSIF